MKRPVKIVLVISIALNVLLAGMQLGYVSHCLVTPGPFNVEGELAKLPADKRELFNSIMGPAKQKMDAARTQLDSAKKNAVEILKTEPFNEEGYLTQVQRIEDMHAKMKREMAQAVAALAVKLTPQERVVLGNIISHPPFTMPPGALKSTMPEHGEQ